MNKRNFSKNMIGCDGYSSNSSSNSFSLVNLNIPRGPNYLKSKTI